MKVVKLRDSVKVNMVERLLRHRKVSYRTQIVKTRRRGIEYVIILLETP